MKKKEKKVTYLINFRWDEDREDFKKLLGIVRYKSNLGVTEAIIEALRTYERMLR